MKYKPCTGRVSPLALRDIALDYVLGKKTGASEPMWRFYGSPRYLFMPLDHPNLLTQVYAEGNHARDFFYRLLVAMETLRATFEHFYPEDGWDRFVNLRKETLKETRCMLFFQVIAWLSINDKEKVEAAIPQMKGLNLSYGLVTQYPEPILHIASCFTCLGMYEQALSEEQRLEFRNQAAILVEEHGMSSRESCLYEEDPYEYEPPEELEPVRNPVITRSIELPIGIDQVLQQQAQTQLLDSARRLVLLSIPRPLRQNLVEILKYLEQISKDWKAQLTS